MINVPIYIPHSTGSSGQSYDVKCIESERLRDIRDKIMLGNEMNEDDVDRVSDCIDEKKRESRTFANIVIWIFGIAVITIIVIAIITWVNL